MSTPVENKTISLKYRWGEEEFLTSNRIHYRLRMKEPAFRFLGYFLVLSVAYGLFIALAHGIYPVLAATLLFAIYWYVLRWRIQRGRLLRDFKTKAKAVREVQWIVDDDGFRGKTDDGSSEFSWDTVRKVVFSEEGFLLYQYPAILFLPRKAFTSDEDLQWMRSTSGSKVEKYVEVY
jgi:hypothetical protein